LPKEANLPVLFLEAEIIQLIKIMGGGSGYLDRKLIDIRKLKSESLILTSQRGTT